MPLQVFHQGVLEDFLGVVEVVQVGVGQPQHRVSVVVQQPDRQGLLRLCRPAAGGTEGGGKQPEEAAEPPAL